MGLNNLVTGFREAWEANRKEVANTVYSGPLGLFYRRGIASGTQYQKLIELADVREGDIVLDVGCGTCPLLGIENRVYGVVGLDIAEGLLKSAEKRGGTLLEVKDTLRRDDISEMFREDRHGVYLVHGDAEHLPFEDDLFDAVIFYNLIPMYVNVRKATEEMARVVKPERRVAAVSVHRGCIPKTAATLEELDFYDVTTGETLKTFREVLGEMREAAREYGKEAMSRVQREWKEERRRNKGKPIPYVYGTKPV